MPRATNRWAGAVATGVSRGYFRAVGRHRVRSMNPNCAPATALRAGEPGRERAARSR